MTNETARALLHRHGLPEDIIDGALCLHAQELAAVQRLRMEELDLTGQKARIVGRIVDLIDPARTPAAAPAVVEPPADQTTPSHRAGLREQIAGALIAWTYRGKEPDPETGILETVRANAYSRADAVLVVLYREWPWLRAEAEDAPPTAGAADRDRIAAAALAAVETALRDTLTPDARKEALAGIMAVLPEPADRATVLRDAAEALHARAKHYTGEFNDSDILHEDGPAATVATWKRAGAYVRRMADETATTQTQPRRGDRFEQWLKTQRDKHRDDNRGRWSAYDDLLDLYRLHADTGTPLGSHVCEAKVVGDCECLEQPAAGARQDDETATTEAQTAIPVCICGHPEARHFEDVCQTCGCSDYLEPGALPDALEAVLTKRYTELGNPFSEMRVHEQGPDGWPSSRLVSPRMVADALRELLPRPVDDGPGLRLPDHTVNEAETPDDEPATGTRQDGAESCAECGDPKTTHREGDDPVSPGYCSACPDDDAWHDYQPATTARQDGSQP